MRARARRCRTPATEPPGQSAGQSAGEVSRLLARRHHPDQPCHARDPAPRTAHASCSFPNAAGRSSAIVQVTAPAGLTPSTRRVGPELRQHLPAGAARRGRRVRVRHDHRAPEPLGAGRDRGAHRGALGADREPVRGVLDVAAHEHAAIVRLERAAHAKTGIGRVRVLLRGASRVNQGVSHSKPRAETTCPPRAAGHQENRPPSGRRRRTWGAGPEAPADPWTHRQQRHDFARVVGGWRRRVVAVIGGKDNEVLLPHPGESRGTARSSARSPP